MHQFPKFILSRNSTCFGQFVCLSSAGYSLYTQQWYMSYSCRVGPGWNSSGQKKIKRNKERDRQRKRERKKERKKQTNKQTNKDQCHISTHIHSAHYITALHIAHYILTLKCITTSRAVLQPFQILRHGDILLYRYTAYRTLAVHCRQHNIDILNERSKKN